MWLELIDLPRLSSCNNPEEYRHGGAVSALVRRLLASGSKLRRRRAALPPTGRGRAIARPSRRNPPACMSCGCNKSTLARVDYARLRRKFDKSERAVSDVES